DASIYQMMPIGVALPRNRDEVSAAVEIARRHGVPILPRGGGSSLAGQAIGHALVLDVSRHMNQVVEIDPGERIVRTQPGITLGRLNRILAKHRLQFGPDPASADRATVGGILGNNSTGSHSIIYGMTVDHVHSMDTVMADGSFACFDPFGADWEARAKRPGIEGEVYRRVPEILDKYAHEIETRYPRTFRHVAGYNLNQFPDRANANLAKLLVGSEGTLAVTTEATLNLVPLPKYGRLAMVHFSTLRAAMEATPVILESDPTAVEVLDKMMIDLCRGMIEYRRLLTFVEGDPDIVLLVEYASDDEADLDAGIERLRQKLNSIHHRDPVVIVTDPRQQANVWYVRRVGLGILMSIRGDAKPIPFIEDAAVPVEHLADYITTIVDYCYEVGLERVAMYAHASAGCIHVRPLVNLKNADGVRQLRAIAEKSVELVCQYGGTTCGEHGEGIVRAEFSEKLFGPALVRAFHEVKDTFDPEGMMNPGKVVNPPRMDDASLLRFGPDYATPHEIGVPVFSYQTDGGFARAVEMCNGAGVCRKVEGVMCPSYQVTRRERDSTRGRANALRAAMMGLLGPDGMTSHEVYDVLDLCLSCKACKAECPSSVDMAKLKSEFLYNYHQEHGTPLRSRLMANYGRLNRLGQPVAPLANLALRGPGRWVMTRLGVHPERKLPRLARQPFSRWYRRQAHSNGNGHGPRKQVVLWHDTFMEHNDPQIGQAAVKVLEAAGYDVTLVEKRQCCGRPAVSKGMLDDARKLAEHNLALLAPYARQGIPITGVEPSCLSMFVDEYRDLVPGPDAEAVAGVVMPIDSLLVQQAGFGDLNLEFDDTPRHVLYHGHCQQKATFGTADTHAMLRLVPNLTVEEVVSGCCGMAGS
ncbi:MAG TPA: FAD-linked oxidase C-terminal domain-containing protein, partial [Aggregatilineales bacterium]|nr:FAD-linked oxidase C-terminal domain-containing protein [Aggregatilineales bacterium]